SHYHYFDALMKNALGEDGWITHQRESWVWMEDRFVPYPFQNNIRYLRKETMWRCLQGIIDVYKHQPEGIPKNFKQWIRATFGAGIAQTFMEPYNFRGWAFPPEDMAYNWIGERVAVTELA